MTDAIIELRTKSVFRIVDLPDVGVAQHTFIVYTNSLGNRMAFRGGPPENKFINAFFKDIEVTERPYVAGHPDYTKSWEAEYPGVVLFRGSDSEMYILVESMRIRAQEINNAKFDYKIPTGIGHLQNCNTVTKALVKAAGLELKLPEYTDGTKAWFPGIDMEFDKTIPDRILSTIEEAAKEAMKLNGEGMQGAFGDDYYQNVNLQPDLKNIFAMADKAKAAQNVLLERGEGPTNTGDHLKDALSLAEYSNKILTMAGVLQTEDVQNKDEIKL